MSPSEVAASDFVISFDANGPNAAAADPQGAATSAPNRPGRRATHVDQTAQGPGMNCGRHPRFAALRAAVRV